jgi:carbamoyltransferase
MPIVETPQQAIAFYLGCDLDILVLDGFFIEKQRHDMCVGPRAIAQLFNEDIQNVLRNNRAEVKKIGGIYRINVSSKKSWTLDLNRKEPVVFEDETLCLPDLVVEIGENDLRCLYTDPDNEGPRLLRENRLTMEGNTALAPELLKLFKLSRIS